jgi:DNA invertase Pin-like site-specific DNA recombinase
MSAGKFVSYLRVSTDKQGRSGLGLEAQRAAVAQYLAGGRGKLVREVVEIESGKRADRPKLATALHLCKVTGATLVIAKLDRLARNVAFLANLMDSGVDFTAADNPHATRLTIHILAAVAEDEAKRISERTKAALKVAKDRGVVLGNPNGARHLRKLGNRAAVAAVRENATSRADSLRTVVEDIQGAGVASIRGIADELNRRGILTPRGASWHATSAARLLERLSS